jgi:multimeric flavodoxin WrbA
MPRTVLVTFYSRGGETEHLAHAAAVGAVQARALIRLRRVADGDPDAAIARNPRAADTMRRMHKEYVSPREADLLAADALIVASPADVDASAAEWADYFQLLGRLQADGRLAGKLAAVVASGAAADSIASAIRRAGLTVIAPASGADATDDMSRAVALGRAVVAALDA